MRKSLTAKNYLADFWIRLCEKRFIHAGARIRDNNHRFKLNFNPILPTSGQRFHFIRPESIRKRLVFWYFQGCSWFKHFFSVKRNPYLSMTINFKNPWFNGFLKGFTQALLYSNFFKVTGTLFFQLFLTNSSKLKM